MQETGAIYMDKECRKYTLTGGSTQMIGKRKVKWVGKNKEMKRKTELLNQNWKVEIVWSFLTAKRILMALLLSTVLVPYKCDWQDYISLFYQLSASVSEKIYPHLFSAQPFNKKSSAFDDMFSTHFLSAYIYRTLSLSCAQTMTKPLLTNGTRKFDQESKCAIWQHNKKAQ